MFSHAGLAVFAFLLAPCVAEVGSQETLLFNDDLPSTPGQATRQKQIYCTGNACDGHIVREVLCWKDAHTPEWECRNTRGLPSICNATVTCAALKAGNPLVTVPSCRVEFSHCYSHRMETLAISSLHILALAIPGLIAWKLFECAVDSKSGTYRGSKYNVENFLFVLVMGMFVLVVAF